MVQATRIPAKYLKCSIEACERLVGERGAKKMCFFHYRRWKNNGDPLVAKIDMTTSPEESFALRTQPSGDCLVWTGAKDDSGYGQIIVNGKSIRAHRYSWEREHAPIPPGMLIDHKCFNPSCVKVSHLRLATRAQNNSHRPGPDKSNKSTGIRNVYPHGNGWRAMVGKSGKHHRSTVYPTIEQAAAAAEKLRQELFGEFAGKG